MMLIFQNSKLGQLCFPALQAGFLPYTLSSDWFMMLIFVLIGGFDYFHFGFLTLNRKLSNSNIINYNFPTKINLLLFVIFKHINTHVNEKKKLNNLKKIVKILLTTMAK